MRLNRLKIVFTLNFLVVTVDVLPFHFLFEHFRLCSRYNNVNYGAWHVYKPLFGSSILLLLASSLVPKFHFQLTKKSNREVREMDGHCINWQMA